VKGDWAHLQVSQLVHVHTGFHIIFDIGSEESNYRPHLWPGSKYTALADDQVRKVVQEWVRVIAPEVRAPNLWDLAAQQQRIATDPATGNTPFTAAERREIGEGLQRLQEHVQQAEPSMKPEHRAALAARMSYLDKAADRLGRLDWTSLVIGQLFAMATEKIITVQTFTSLYSLAADLFGRVLAIGPAVVQAAGRLIGS
jgi:hypothetical protein